MNRSLLERLRPVPEQPDPVWAAGALSSILRSADHLSSDVPGVGPTRLVLVDVPRRSRSGRRRLVALAAAAVVLVAGAGVARELGQDATTRTLVADPAAPAPQAADDPVATDLGPLPADQRRTLVAACRDEGGPLPVARVHYARSTSDGSGKAVRSVAVVEDHRGEYRLCVSPTPVHGVPNTEQSGYGPGVLGPGGDLSPTSGRPLSVISAHQYGYLRRGGTFVDVHLGVAYAVTPEVDRVEVRLTGAGADEQWFAGAVHDGFTFIPVVVPELDAPDDRPDVTVESRGYDADGRLVATDEQHHLSGNRDSPDDERLFWG